MHIVNHLRSIEFRSESTITTILTFLSEVKILIHLEFKTFSQELKHEDQLLTTI